jgi:hypothetical protein
VGKSREDPPPVLFSKRYDSKGVKGWGSVNDVIPWKLEGGWVRAEGGGSPDQNGKNTPPPRLFSERVRKHLSAKEL